MEWANIAGLEVSPATPSSRIRRARLPSCSMRRLMSSSQTLSPSLRNSSNGLGTGAFMEALLRESSAAGSAGARHRQVPAQQPLAGGRRRGRGCAAARARHGAPLMDAPPPPAQDAGAGQPLRSAFSGLLGAGLDALRARLELAAVELEI